MRREGYVDANGRPIDPRLVKREGTKKIFFIISVIVPLTLVIILGVKIYQNVTCQNIYINVINATKKYAKEEEILPEINGNSVYVKIIDLYNRNYLSNENTLKKKTSGKIKITKVNDNYIYTLDLKNCDYCSTNQRYSNWSDELTYYPVKKAIVDVIPYYNYYEREVNNTAWSDYFEPDEISNEKSKYGVYLPLEEDVLPAIPEGANIYTIETETQTRYLATHKMWRWYKGGGDYSNFSSEKPEGYANKDSITQKYTDWSKYSLNYPEEKTYREISEQRGFQWYYEKNGKKIYYDNKNYAVKSDVDTTLYTEQSEESQPMYKYRDKEWRWYNGNKRDYSAFYSKMPSGYPNKDEEIYQLKVMAWAKSSSINSDTALYITEETSESYRYRINYEFLSEPVLNKDVTMEEFISITGLSIEEFMLKDDYKLKISYKYKYKR